MSSGSAQPREADRCGVLLTLRPRFAEAILSGAKTVELRRRMAALTPGTVVVLYAAAPVKSVVGTARLEQISEGPPHAVWDGVAPHCGVSRVEFDAYFAGAVTAYALHLALAARAPRPMPLEELRRRNLWPARSWRYLAGGALGEFVPA